MTPIMNDIKSLLATLPYDLKEARIDPTEVSSTPALSVRLHAEDLELIGNDPIFRAETIVVIEAVVTDSDTYYADIKVVVNTILEKLLTDPYWFNKYEQVKSIRVKYEYDPAGDTNLAAAQIQIVLQDTEIFEPLVVNGFEIANFDLDDASPFDSTIATTGPDGRIEITASVNIPQ